MIDDLDFAYVASYIRLGLGSGVGSDVAYLDKRVTDLMISPNENYILRTSILYTPYPT